MLSPEISPVREDPRATLDQFTKRLWMHPLVSEETLAFRKECIDVITEAFELHKVNPKYCFAIPTGSFATIPTKHSDRDIFLMHTIPDNLRERQQLRDGIYELETQALDGLSVMNVLPIESLMLPVRINAIPVILWTPDEYIAGNKELAIDTRRRLAQMFLKPESESRWGKHVVSVYDTFYRDWRKLPTGQGKREARFQNALETHPIDERWRPTWEKVVIHRTENLVLPPREIYLSAIIANNGALALPKVRQAASQ